jgi:hypothetical protein
MHRSISFTAVRHGRSLEIAGRHHAILSTSAASAVLPDGCCAVGHLEREPAGHYRLGEDGAPADAACQHRRITLGERLCNLMGIEVVRVAAVENDPSTEPRPKRVRFVDEPERLGESRKDERRQPNRYEYQIHGQQRRAQARRYGTVHPRSRDRRHK